jgi:hypothetical protein
VQGASNTGTGEVALVLLAAVHEAGHLNLGDVELLAAEVGKGNVGNFVISLGW